MKILVIEDERQLLASIKASLEKENFLVETANNYREAIEKVFIYDYDCILLDIMLPDGSGLDILSELKKEGKGGNVIIISAKDLVDDKIQGLELGADDYLTKPFHLGELNARVKAVLRRKVLNGEDSIEYFNVKLEFDTRRCLINREVVPLNRKEFDIMGYFIANKNRLVTKIALAEHVWGDNTDQAANLDFVYSQIKNLRKKLIESKADVIIESIYGIGYKLIEK